MNPAEPASLSQFLNYGGLGLLAILCIVVLGYNVWSLNRLVARAEVKRVNAARPLLLAQMGVSLVGLLAVGLGGIYLDQLKAEGGRTRMAQVVVDPLGTDVEEAYRPEIRVAGNLQRSRIVSVTCEAGQPTPIEVNFERFLERKLGRSALMQRTILPLSAATSE